MWFYGSYGLIFLLDVRGVLLFLIPEDRFNTKTSDLILVVYVNIVKYILTQISW